MNRQRPLSLKDELKSLNTFLEVGKKTKENKTKKKPPLNSRKVITEEENFTPYP